MRIINPELRGRLASEYVLGTLRGGARRRFEQFLKSDYALRAEVAKWETHLTPLIERLKPIAAPAHVWLNIEAKIAGSSKSASTIKAGWLSSLTFWRGLGVATSLVASVLFAALLTLKSNEVPSADPVMMAVLEDQGVARMVIEQPKSGLLMVKMVKPWAAVPNQSLELWVIPKDGAPRTLGVINDDGETKITMPDIEHRLTDGTVFAITNEPKGGSLTGKPTGSIMCKGTIARMPAKVDTKQRGQI